jgi:hypothetical protein
MQQYLLNKGIRMLIAIAVIFWIEVLVLQAVRASELQGMDDPALQAAIDTWLVDNDEDSLPVFATLAAQGNIAARMLLARIEVTDQGPSDFVDGLSRKERVEIFRSNSGTGLFRPTWLKSEKAAGNQFASVLLDSTNTVVDVDAIRKLYEMGEPEAAYDLIRETAGNGSPEEKKALVNFLPADSELMPYLRALQNPLLATTPGHAALQLAIDANVLKATEADARAAANFVEYGYQTGVQTNEFNRSNAYYDDLKSWIQSASVTAPIATMCRRYCGEDTGDCAITAFGLVGGYYKAIKFDSPMQTLIAQSRYATSERAVGMVLRRVSFARPAGASRKFLISDSELRATSACLAKAVAKVRERRN